MHTIDLTRLLKLAGRPLMEKMSYQDAEAVFSDEGEFVRGFSAAAMNRAWKRLQRRYHEAGTNPNPTKIAKINAAYDVLKTGGGEETPVGRRADAAIAQGFTVWGWNGERLIK